MDKRFLVIIGALVVIFGGFIVFNQKSAAPGKNSVSLQPTNNVFGEGKSGVKLIEYGDLQCPACGQYYPIVKQLKEKYKADITFQFRNFPLDSIHQNARAAARAAQAAADQGKFWEMHDHLYEAQAEWKDSNDAKTIFESYASQLGLNIEKFKTDFASEATNSVINADIKEGQKIGANSTPTFVLDGQKIENPRGYDPFVTLIDSEIAKKKTSTKTPDTAPNTAATAAKP